VTATAEPSVLMRTAKGVGWIVAWRMVTRLLGVASTLTLVRLLLPADFGLVALGTGFAQAVDALSTLGVEDALIREPNPTPAMYHTAYTMDALRSVLTALVIAGAAVPVGAFFKEPRLANVLFALAISSLVQGTNSVGTVDFRRDMAFQKEFQLQVLPRLIMIATTITCALIWRSYWALIAGIMAGRVARWLFGFAMHPYRPVLTLSAWRSLIGFSLWTWAASIAQLAAGRTDGFIIGRMLGATSVGVYSIGAEIATLPSTELVDPLCRVCFSTFTQARVAGTDVSKLYLRIVATAFVVTLPAGIGISLVADPLVRLAVGTRWLAAIPVIQAMGLVSIATVFGSISATLLSVYGLLKRHFGITAAGIALRLAIGIPLTGRYGLPGAAVGMGLAIVIDQAGFVIWSFRRFGIRIAALLPQLWRPSVATLAMAGVLVWLHLGWTEIAADRVVLALRLTETVTLGMVVYAGVLGGCWLLSGRPDGAEQDLLRAGGGFLRHLARLAGLLLRQRRRVSAAPASRDSHAGQSDRADPTPDA
jgi:lipopolysaccharide exporter